MKALTSKYVYSIGMECKHVLVSQGSDTRVILKKLVGFLDKPIENSNKKPAPNFILFQFVVPVIIRHFFTFTASNDQ